MARLGEVDALKRATSELRAAYPGFEAVAFVETLPYEHGSDRQDFLDALDLATSGVSR